MYWLSDAVAVPPRVGYAIGRAVGPAVARNRLRRRLRALLADRAYAGQVAPGWYLVGCRAEAASAAFGELGGQIDRLLGLVAREAPVAPPLRPGRSGLMSGPR